MALRATAKGLAASFFARTSRSARATFKVQAYQQAEDSSSQPWTPPPFPAIGTIKYSPELESKIRLTGKLGSDMQPFETANGLIGRLPLYVRPKARQPDYSEKYTIEVFSGLAEAASGQLTKGMLIHVEGRLRCEPWVDKESNPRVAMVVEAEQIFIVDDNAPPLQQLAPAAPQPIYGSQQQQYTPQAGGRAPQQQQQYTQQQAPAQQRYGAPAQQQYGAPAQQQYEAPAQQQYGGGGGAPAAAGRQPFAKITPAREAELWQELSDNMSAFWDNRQNKRNPKAPDFKHKQTGEGLWVTAINAPQWVRE